MDLEPIFLNGVKIGILKEDSRGLTYETWRDPQKHFFITHQGYAIDTAVLQLMKQKGVVRIEITFSSLLKPVQESKIDWWFEDGIPIHKEGYQPQLVLPEKVRTHRWYELMNQKLTAWCKDEPK